MPSNIVKPACLFLSIVLFAASCIKEEPLPSPEKAITSFSLRRADSTRFNTQDVLLTMGEDSILVSLPPGTDLTDLIATVTFDGVSLNPPSGSHVNFSHPVKYTVTAADSSKREYTVVITSRKMLYFGAARNFYAVDQGTGLLMWSYADGSSFAYSDPAFQNGIVYAGSTSGKMYAFNAKTGAVIWQKALGSYGIESGAAVAGNTLYVGDNNDIFYALDATTGQEKWRFTAFSNIETNPVLFNNTVIFGADDATVYALDTTTGSTVWTFRTENSILASSPKISNGVVFIGEDNGYLYAINATNGQLKWKYSTNGVSLGHSTPAIYNGVVYIAGAYVPFSHYSILGSLYAVNEFTGQEVWRSLDSLGFSTSPCVDNGKVYVSADNGNLYAVDAASGSILWQKSIYANSASGAVYGNTLYVGGSGTLNFYAFDKTTGEEKWRYGIGQQCCGNSTPVIGE